LFFGLQENFNFSESRPMILAYLSMISTASRTIGQVTSESFSSDFAISVLQIVRCPHPVHCHLEGH
jgi:hypothetical protein